MTKPEITQKLTESHAAFAGFTGSLSDADFLYAPNGKWTAGQQLLHIYLSVKPLNMAMSLPKIGPRIMFGKANRPSRDYDGVVEKYHEKLAEGGTAPSTFVPEPVSADQKTVLTAKLNKLVSDLCRNIEDYNEGQLEEYVLPHPLLGKLTVREMLYFTIYHVGHHHKITAKNLGKE